MDGAERAKEAGGGGRGAATKLTTCGNSGGGGAVQRIASVDERAHTEFEPKPRCGVGRIRGNRGGDHRLHAGLQALFVNRREGGAGWHAHDTRAQFQMWRDVL